MKKIVIKWIVICCGVGLIPVFFLGASPGGAALIPGIIFLSLSVGLIGSAIHSMFFAFTRGSSYHKKCSVGLFFSVAIFMLLANYSNSQCRFTEQYAIEKVENHVTKYEHLDLKYLSTPVFSKKECQYKFTYNSPEKQYEFIFSEYGEVATWEKEADGL